MSKILKKARRLDDIPFDTVLQDKRIILNLKPYKKMFYYTLGSPGEISGFCKVKIVEEDVIVLNTIIFKQTCSGASTTLDGKALANFLYQLDKKGENPADYNLWWHSHDDGQVFWSAIDEANIKRLTKDSMWISICINKKGEMTGRIDEGGIGAEVPIIIQPTSEFVLKSKCFKEVKRKVKEESIIGVNTGVNIGGIYGLHPTTGYYSTP